MEDLNRLLQEHLDDLLKPDEPFDWAEEVEETLTVDVSDFSSLYSNTEYSSEDDTPSQPDTLGPCIVNGSLAPSGSFSSDSTGSIDGVWDANDYASDDGHSTFVTDATTFSDTSSVHSSEIHVPDDIREEGVEKTPTVEIHVPDDIRANVYNESFYIGCDPSDPYPRPEGFKPSLYTIDELDELLMEENQEPDVTDVPVSDGEIEDLFTQIEAHLNLEPDTIDVPASDGEIKDLYTQIEAHLDAEPHEPSPPLPYDDGPTRASKSLKSKSKIARLMRVGISELFRWVYRLLDPALP
ncbi:hypothetical protein ATEIFO6365_0009032900 [Aspergillus terreus]|uniref:Uncharacterized protein n=1 Tax=Aspergillus terreus TaxID=33178 RepID=A0A5M3Z840_ASPTE|nr:hypothetical protein ATETN484_0011032900 [Aspergillus terreus]GFF18966.1 hypothetical protein ATEIFO6365_0009032900 [Aspergillus terreus]